MICRLLIASVVLATLATAHAAPDYDGLIRVATDIVATHNLFAMSSEDVQAKLGVLPGIERAGGACDTELTIPNPHPEGSAAYLLSVTLVSPDSCKSPARLRMLSLVVPGSHPGSAADIRARLERTFGTDEEVERRDGAVLYLWHVGPSENVSLLEGSDTPDSRAVLSLLAASVPRSE